MRSLEINLILQPPIPGFPGISMYVVCTHYLGLSILPGRSSVIWRELKNPATTESNTSYIENSNSMRSRETWSWDLMRLGLIESHENSHLTRVILKKISISWKHMRRDWDPTLEKTEEVLKKGLAPWARYVGMCTFRTKKWDTDACDLRHRLVQFVFVPGHHPRFETYTNPFPCHIQPIRAICILHSAICILLKFLCNVVLESISVLFRRKISILHKSNFVES